MTATHASRPHIDVLPQSLRSLYFPPDTKLERFVYGKPVKGRNEPSAIGGVAWVLQRMNEGVQFERITERAWKNTVEVFRLDELRDASEDVLASTST
jgi:TatD DNase family protein